MNDADIKAITQKLADVDLPPQPDWLPVYIGAAILLALLVTALQLARRRYLRARRPNIADSRRIALDQLEKIRSEWLAHQLSDQQAAFRLATAVRLGLGLNQLDETPPTTIDPREWQQAMTQLKHLRYDIHAEATLDETLFDTVGAWLCGGDNPPC